MITMGDVISFNDAEKRITTYTYASFFWTDKYLMPDSTYKECEYINMGKHVLHEIVMACLLALFCFASNNQN